MSFGKIILASVLGGLAMFVWGAVSHMALNVGDMGLQSLPGDRVLMPQMKTAIPERGLYFFPGGDMKDESKRKEFEERMRQGPTGLIIYNPTGSEPMSPMQLVKECISNILCALFMALVFSRMRVNAASGAMLGLLFGLFAWMSLSVSYWNWYGFPDDFTIGQCIDQSVSGLLTGLVVGLVLRQRGVVAA